MLCNIHKIIFSAFFSEPGCSTPQDLFSLLYSSAYFAGKDWTAIGREYSAYYGYGFLALFSGLYRLTNDGFLIYRVICVCCNLLVVLSCILCYKILLMFETTSNKWLLFVISIAVTSTQGTSYYAITNEHALNVCVWLVLYLLMRLCDAQMLSKRRIGCSLLLGIALVYSCMVHARAVIIYMLVFLCVIAIKIIGKRMIVNIPVILATSLLYLPYRYFTDFLQITLLGEVNLNSSVAARTSNALMQKFSWEQIETFLMSILFYLHELSVITAGMVIICTAGIIYALYSFILKHSVSGINASEKERIICGLIYSLCGIGAFIAGMCFTTLGGLYAGFTKQSNENLRSLTLVRYFTPFIAPMCLFTIVIIMKIQKPERKKILLMSTMVLCVIQYLFIHTVLPNIKHTGWAWGVYKPYTWNIEMEKQDVYLIGGVIALFYLCFINFICVRRSNWWGLCVILLLFNAEGIMYRYYDYETSQSSFLMECVDGGYKYFRQQDERKDIYVVETIEDGGTELETYYFFYQLLLPNMRILPKEPEEAVAGTIILTNSPKSIRNNNRYEMIQLDNNEWMLTAE